MTDKMTIEQAIKVLKSLELQLASENFSKALEVAIEALEKQIPKRPIILETGDYACPICGKFLIPTFPCVCGQAIDWSDDDCEECIHFDDDTDKCLSCGLDGNDWFTKKERDTNG